MSFPTLFRKEIPEQFTQENFKRIQDFHLEDPFSNGNFKFFEISVLGAVTNQLFPHNLGFLPMDVILLHNSQNATVTFNYSAFTRDNIYYTTSGATVIRFLLGRIV